MKKLKIAMILSILFFPISVFAYSSTVILGGENVGIHIEMPGVMVIGFYKVNGSNITSSPNIEVGDIITEVNGTQVTKIDELTSAIENLVKNDQITLSISRNGENIKTTLNLIKTDGVYKTGLYVKDSITGLGTISYIDPETKVYGALGHEILESTSGNLVEVKTGSIFESTVTSIKKSSNGTAGEKNANFNLDHIFGNIETNTNHGIFGIYEEEIEGSTIEVANKEEVKVGSASIYTVLSGNEKKEYEIEITNIQEYNDVKNITFEITDHELIDKTGGIVQGMSGSPIVQNGKIIGAVTHVIIDNPLTGYGIFITTMLENGDKIL